MAHSTAAWHAASTNFDLGVLQEVHEDDTAESNENLCSVCLDSFAEGDELSLLPCTHKFHNKCIQPWVRQSGTQALCPLCKTAIFDNR